jgi:hypothetical protein
VVWAIRHKLLNIWHDEEGEPVAGIIFRPIPNWLWGSWEKGELKDYFHRLYDVDPGGDNLWCDFLWAPGQYGKVIPWLKATGKQKAGWEHRQTGKVHVVRLNRLPDRSVCSEHGGVVRPSRAGRDDGDARPEAQAR